MRMLLPFAVVITILSAASAPRNEAAIITQGTASPPGASPIHPKLLEFFEPQMEPQLEAPVLVLPDLAPGNLAIGRASLITHI